MIQRGQQVNFTVEARQARLITRTDVAKDFDGDISTHFRIAGAIDFAHPADAKLSKHFVGSDTTARLQPRLWCHRRNLTVEATQSSAGWRASKIADRLARFRYIRISRSHTRDE